MFKPASGRLWYCISHRLGSANGTLECSEPAQLMSIMILRPREYRGRRVTSLELAWFVSIVTLCPWEYWGRRVTGLEPAQLYVHPPPQEVFGAESY